jgi:hypothetical protein
MTKVNKIEILNIVLIFISLFLSLMLPFELFLFSYAVLGPLHYLTEINWLHQKNYFVQERKYIWILIVFAIAITFLAIFKYLKLEVAFSTFLSNYSKLLFNVLLVSSLFFSIGLVLFKDSKKIFLALIFSFIFGLLFLKFFPFSFIIIGVFLPTIIHVYFFTLIFMIFGTLKSRSIYGVIAIVVLMLVPLFILYNPFLFAFQTSELVKDAFLETSFKKVIVSINQIFNNVSISYFNFNSAVIIKIQTIITFSYTYHYLNWFSKTSLIGWSRNMSKSYLVFILILWLASIGLYVYSYKMGVMALFFLSMFHVIAEFPLNIISIREVFFSRKAVG